MGSSQARRLRNPSRVSRKPKMLAATSRPSGRVRVASDTAKRAHPKRPRTCAAKAAVTVAAKSGVSIPDVVQRANTGDVKTIQAAIAAHQDWDLRSPDRATA